MKIRKTLLIALLMSASGITLMAQDGPPPDEGNGAPGGRKGKGDGPMSMLSVDTLKKELTLTDDQVTKLTPLIDKAKELFKALGKEMRKNRENGGDMEDMREKMEETHAKMLKIFEPAKDFLSAEQYKALTEKLNKRPGPPKGKPGEGGPGEGPGGDNQ